MFPVVCRQVLFQGRVPDFDCIGRKVTEVSGLPVEAGRSSGNGFVDNKEFYTFDGMLFFSCAPKTRICLWAFTTEPVWDKEDFDALKEFRAMAVDGACEEPPGTQAVYVECGSAQEMTLFQATLGALEALGGSLDGPLPDEARVKYGTPVAAGELQRRLRAAAWRYRLDIALIALLLMVAAPVLFVLVSLVYLVAMLVFAVLVPWFWWRTMRYPKAPS